MFAKLICIIFCIVLINQNKWVYTDFLKVGTLAKSRVLTLLPLAEARQPNCDFYLKHHWRNISCHKCAENSCNERENNNRPTVREAFVKQ